MGTNFFLRHHNLGDLLNHFADTTGSHLLKGSIYQGHIWKHRGKGKSAAFCRCKILRKNHKAGHLRLHIQVVGFDGVSQCICCHCSFSIFQPQCFFHGSSRLHSQLQPRVLKRSWETIDHPHWWCDIVGFFGGRRLCEHRQRIEQLMACQARKISRWAVGIGSDSIGCYVIDGR